MSVLCHCLCVTECRSVIQRNITAGVARATEPQGGHPTPGPFIPYPPHLPTSEAVHGCTIMNMYGDVHLSIVQSFTSTVCVFYVYVLYSDYILL